MYQKSKSRDFVYEDNQDQLKNISHFPRFLLLVEVCGGKLTWKSPPWWTSKKEQT